MTYPQFDAFQKLQKLALKPFDLTSGLDAKRIEKMTAQGVGFQLLYGTERVDAQVMEALLNLAEEAKALEKMAAMQRGEVINRIEGFESENRAVLHTAMRDQFDHRQSAKEASDATE